ncbi:uncharacterized protein LOC111281641 [Durio zibethinus]|uniref:Uncharacterized protein LOC111281641 n=1 Tax=Durio zibethinus TaxID=66656 RepID=A0A6P5X9X7_DURZI|nr:uncharacterized protein LOC111281641 [Durio zibethinus]
MNEEQEINKKRKSNCQEYQVTKRFEEFDEEDNDLLALSLSYGSKTTTNKALPPTPPATLPQQQEQPQQIVSQSLSMQTLLSQPPTQFPLQLSASHPLYSVPFVSGASSSATLVYPQEPVSSSSLSVVPGTGTGTGPGPSRPIRVRRNPTQAPREGKSETVTQPFPWATTHRATVHSVNYLLSKQIFTITGDVQCKRCERQYEIAYDLKGKFAEIGTFIAEKKNAMHDRAPPVWMNPVLPKCKFCDQENSVKPVISDKKKSINWLFLLLGQMLGCCTLEQLKYFCKHTKNHRTGAKDRVLYLTYLGLCKQLDPNGPFNR